LKKRILVGRLTAASSDQPSKMELSRCCRTERPEPAKSHGD
jgi:hypothetical protein